MIGLSPKTLSDVESLADMHCFLREIDQKTPILRKLFQIMSSQPKLLNWNFSMISSNIVSFANTCAAKTVRPFETIFEKVSLEA